MILRQSAASPTTIEPAPDVGAAEANFPPASQTSVSWILLYIAGAALCLFVLFRPFWLSHFNLILSDPVDGSFDVSMLEHWFSVVRGHVPAFSPHFFYPKTHVLGYSDGFFLLAIPYVVLRFLGCDRYLAMQLTMIVLTTISFVCMLYFFRRVLSFARTAALFGALLFMTSNMYYIHMVHPHLISIVFVPVLLVLAGRWWQTRDRQTIWSRLYMFWFGTLLALLLFTSFYIGWFTVLFLGTGLLFYFLSIVAGERSTRAISAIAKAVLKQKETVLLACGGFCLAISPFLLLYLPALHRFGPRPFAYTLSFIPPPAAVFDVGRDNLLWGGLSARIEHLASTRGVVYEHPLGWPLFTVCIFLLSALYCGVELYRGTSQMSDRRKWQLCFASSMSITCLALWLVELRIGNTAPVWRLFWAFVPGATAIRVPHRVNLVLNIGVITTCIFGIQELSRALSRHRIWSYAAALLLGTALFAEQLNGMTTHLISRTHELQRYAKIGAPPRSCSSFYVSSWSPQRLQMLEFQTGAMLEAEELNLPTIDGYSSWFPKDWDELYAGTSSSITEKAREWADWHTVSHGLCALDMTSGKWSVVNPDSPRELGHLVPGAIPNPGFENVDLAPWRPFQQVHAEVTHDHAHTGAASVAESGPGSVYLDVSGLPAGATYTVAAWFSGSPGTTATAQLATLSSPDAPTFSASPTPTPLWHMISHTALIGSSGVLRVHLTRGPGSGTVYWDDVSIYRTN